MEERNKNNSKRTAKRSQTVQIVAIVVMCLLLAAIIFFIVRIFKQDATPKPIPEQTSEHTTNPGSDVGTDPATQEATEAPTKGGITASQFEDILKYAGRLAAMYDYDAAVAYIEEKVPSYESYTELSTFVNECGMNKSQLVKWADNTQITHVFFHSLIMECDVAFASGSSDNYNQVMTTIDEFNRILQAMYDRGYVLVRLSDIASINPETGKMQYNAIYLPKGKKPFVLSEDDVSYYEYMKKDGGFPNRLIVMEDGKVMNEVDNPDGSKTVGAFDVVPILDAFVEEHPDFSYHGAKGIVALTGYNGVLGYRTSFVDYANATDLQTAWDSLTKNEKFDYNYAANLVTSNHAYDNNNLMADRETAKKVAAAMRANGWDFASHTWGHTNMGNVVDAATGNVTSQWLYADTIWWKTEVESIIGDTDIIIFAYGADIYTWRPYTDSNQAFLYLKSQGFDYFCNVDSSQYFVQMNATAGGSGFLRQGRRNLDGQLMLKALLYPEQNLLSDLFDVKQIFDPVRPLPVKGVKLPENFDEAAIRELLNQSR